MMRMAFAMVLLGLLVQVACARPECAGPDYTHAECRVLAENEVARLHTSTNVELRFQHPEATTSKSWAALGVFEELQPGLVRARVAAPGSFALTIEGGAEAPATFEVQLENVDPRALVEVGPRGEEAPLPSPEQPGPTRRFSVSLPEDETIWVRGRIDCPSRFRLAVLGDIQTNPFQFERIVDRLQREAFAAENAEEPLLGLLILGDLTELSGDVEFALVEELIQRLPFPTAVTPGNHDVFSSSRAIYNRFFGPGNYGFDLCSARVVMLDSGNGGLARSVEGRLWDLLQRDGQEFLLAGTHYPAYPGLTGNGWSKENQAQHLLAELAIARADLLLAGHIHSLFDFDEISVGDRELRQIVSGTGGASQGFDVPRYGYVELTFGDQLETCFMEVSPAGADGPLNEPISGALPNCNDPP